MINKGLFIIVDGPSGSGKDSIISEVQKKLNKLNIKTIAIEETKEKSYDGQKILAAKKYGDRKVAEAIINERQKLYQIKVMPQLLTNHFVIANRGESTTLGYQTLKNEISMEAVWNMHRNKNIPLPDLVVITNCSVKEAMRRESLRELSSEEKDKKFMSGKFTKDNYEKRKQIHNSYEKVRNFLEKKGLFVIYLNADTMAVPEESRLIVNYIEKKLIAI